MKIFRIAALIILTHTSSGAFGFANFDDRLRNLSDHHPEFAGLYTDKAGNLVLLVSTKDNSSKSSPIVFAQSYDAAKTLIDPSFLESLLSVVGKDYFENDLYQESKSGLTAIDSEGNKINRPDRKFGVKQATYSFAMLYDWYRSARHELLGMPGVQGGDIDEKRNCIKLLISPEIDFSLVNEKIKSYGIPLDAINYEMTSEARLASTLRNYSGAPAGGLQIAFKKSPTSQDSFCSLGFLTRIGGVTGYVTASHCSKSHGIANDGTNIFVGPSTSTGTLLGSPTISSTGYACAGGWTCFESDALFVPKPSGISSRQGVFKTNSINTGSLTVMTTFYNTWSALEMPTSTLVGHRAFKTGRTTGTTSGSVTAVCVDRKIGIVGGYHYLCLNEVLGDGGEGSFVNQGDSGSAVLGSSYNEFGGIYPYSRGARLLGVVAMETNERSYYFPIDAVESALGNLEII